MSSNGLDQKEIKEIAKTITLEGFASLLSKVNISNTYNHRREEQIAKEAGIVIAFGDDGWTFLRGAINHEIRIEDDDQNPFYGCNRYFDQIGFFWPYQNFESEDELEDYLKYVNYEVEVDYFDTFDEWEKYLGQINKKYFKMKPDFSECNFPYLQFFSQENDGYFGPSGIIFYMPKYDGIYLEGFRVPSYEESEIEDRRRQKELFDQYSEENRFGYWFCDACGGDQDTGCLSSSVCFRK